MTLTALHHVEMCVGNGRNMVSYFSQKLGFSLRAVRETEHSLQWVVGSNKAAFVITERLDKVSTDPHFLAPFSSFCCPDSDSHSIDSVFNVALEVKNLDRVTEEMCAIGGRLFQPVTVVEDETGSVRYSIVGSCCGNVCHTLLDKSAYRGQFLPTFDSVNNNEGSMPEPFTHGRYLIGNN